MSTPKEYALGYHEWEEIPPGADKSKYLGKLDWIEFIHVVDYAAYAKAVAALKEVHTFKNWHDSADTHELFDGVKQTLKELGEL